MNNDFIKQLEIQSIRRQKLWDPNQRLDSSFFALELVGEFGELCNCLKKVRRGQLEVAGSVATKKDVADECADVMITLVNLVTSCGDDLHCIARKLPKGVVKLNPLSFAGGMATLVSKIVTKRPDRIPSVLALFIDNLVDACEKYGDVGLEDAVVRKFNATSEKQGFDIKL